ncbi:response regulator transcription factor [Leuconostoc lactis]|uniref:response regulator transcription factor n=1 Tax=Leuconostoc lactis TaxID=1246 RepID=UPI00241CB50B|nr:DNA-binding response regulator [Leuconostoc lactis]
MVEDDQTIQRVVKQTLVTAGFEVTQAFDAHTTQTQLLATLPDEVLHLSQKEYALLSLFIQHPQKVLTYAVLLRNIWGTHLLQGQNDTLRVTVAHLRRKIGTNAGQQYIGTDVGVGYRWLSPVTMHALLEQ